MLINKQIINKLPHYYNIMFSFHRIYKKDTQGGNANKKLMLLPQFGRVELNAIFYGKLCSAEQLFLNELSTINTKRDVRKVKLVVTTYQMCVLDLFNVHNTLTYEVIYSSLFFMQVFEKIFS